MLPGIRFSGEPPPRQTSGRPPSEQRLEEARGKRAVLVVEDEPDALQAILELLRGEGVTAVGAMNGQDALSLLVI